VIDKDGGHVAFGSAWPAAPLDPLRGLEAALDRSVPAGVPASERNRLAALETAIDAYTAGGAWASFDEQRKGAIEAGMLADLVVLSTDIFDLPAEAPGTARVEVTIFDGKVVYRRSSRRTD
jgi:predicted amidohydrolase YtcJ